MIRTWTRVVWALAGLVLAACASAAQATPESFDPGIAGPSQLTVKLCPIPPFSSGAVVPSYCPTTFAPAWTCPPVGSGDGGAPEACPTPPLTTPDRLPTDLPVDSSLAAVSLSNPSPEASAALSRCVRRSDWDKIAGMAQLPARDLHRFTYTNGHEPELQTDALVWAIQLRGDNDDTVGIALDPLCVVIDGIAWTYPPWGMAGEHYVAPSSFVLPGAALPSPAP
jgi:hypothetical protein